MMASWERDEGAGPRARILQVDVLGGDLHIAQGGLDVGVTHQLHERGQADPAAYHVRGEGVAEAMRVGEGDTGALAMVAEQGT